ncbi:MAG: hypothetical protein ACI93T_004402, partial [Porticoccaceae bacterium]
MAQWSDRLTETPPAQWIVRDVFCFESTANSSDKGVSRWNCLDVDLLPPALLP